MLRLKSDKEDKSGDSFSDQLDVHLPVPPRSPRSSYQQPPEVENPLDFFDITLSAGLRPTRSAVFKGWYVEDRSPALRETVGCSLASVPARRGLHSKYESGRRLAFLST
jgi:hypothetical protein